MVLNGFKEEGMWLNSDWAMTYPAGWEHITRAVAAVYDFYTGTELLANGRPVSIKEKQEIANLPEGMNLTIRGCSKLIKVPVAITFHNQVRAVSVSVCKMSKEFENTDYEKLNKSLGCYLDSIELAMYR